MDEKYYHKENRGVSVIKHRGVMKGHLGEAGSSVHGLEELGDGRATVTLRVRLRNRILVEPHCLRRQPALVQLLIFIRHQHHIFHLIEEKRKEKRT